jgi:predicted Holliday junction resolvase-like endonuclease
METAIFFVALVLFFGIIIALYRKEMHLCLDALDQAREQNKSLVSQFASFRVRHGMVFETFLPQMKQFEDVAGPAENAHHMGQPIDFIYFNDDEIVFVEVKTGNSKLSNRQRLIKKLVKEGKVRWAELNDHSAFASPDTDLKSLEVSMITTSPEASEPSSSEQSTS